MREEWRLLTGFTVPASYQPIRLYRATRAQKMFIYLIFINKQLITLVMLNNKGSMKYIQNIKKLILQ